MVNSPSTQGEETWHIEYVEPGSQGWPRLVAPNGDSIKLAAGEGEANRFVCYLNDQILRLESEARAARLARSQSEHLEDLLDWAKRWQAGRRRNSAMKNPDHARIILDAQAMNRELDGILSAIDAMNQGGQHADPRFAPYGVRGEDPAPMSREEFEEATNQGEQHAE